MEELLRNLAVWTQKNRQGLSASDPNSANEAEVCNKLTKKLQVSYPELVSAYKTPHNPVKNRTKRVEIGVRGHKNQVEDDPTFALQGHESDPFR